MALPQGRLDRCDPYADWDEGEVTRPWEHWPALGNSGMAMEEKFHGLRSRYHKDLYVVSVLVEM